MCLILEVKPKFVNQMFLLGLIVLAIALLFKVRGNSRITIALYAFWNSPLAIRLVWLFLSIICIVLLLAFNDPVFCTGSDNNGGTTPTHISTSISNKSVSDTPISLNFTTTLKTGGDGASSVIELISDEQQLVFACIIFCGVALWMFVGLLFSLALLRFGDWILPRIADRPILMRLYRYYSVSSTALIVILSLIIIYSLAFTLLILYRLY